MGSHPKRKLDYDDYAAAPSDGQRYEIIRGELYVTPAPGTLHQRLLGRLFQQLAAFYHPRGRGEVFVAPIDLILTRHDILQPDLVVVTSASDMTDRGIERPPLLVVEILSPSSRRQDRGIKLERYAQLGVQHYWIVDPEARSVECFCRAGDAFRPLTEARGAETLCHEQWDGLEIDLEPLWRPSAAPAQPAAGEPGGPDEVGSPVLPNLKPGEPPESGGRQHR
jgi:Uma2 family endonuclease